MGSFTIVLDSQENLDFYPDNSLFYFYNFLQNPITFEHDELYEVNCTTACVYRKDAAITGNSDGNRFFKWNALITSNFSNSIGSTASVLSSFSYRLFMLGNGLKISHLENVAVTQPLYVPVRPGYYDSFLIQLDSKPGLPDNISTDLAGNFALNLILRFRTTK